MEASVGVKIPDISPSSFRRQLTLWGATKADAERMIRRSIFDHSDGRLDRRGAWLRVQEDNGRSTLSYKEIAAEEQDVHEISVAIDNFDRAVDMLKAGGLVEVMYQERKRETWRRGAIRITIHQWPWIPPFVEIEGQDELAVRKAVEGVKLVWANVILGNIEMVYQKYYDVTAEEVYNWPRVSFGDVPDWLEQRRKASIHGTNATKQ